ncbi:MAG TPA: hypothetical protein VGO93_04875 [Candidatus Xenobia bacterium]|jgi:hypothetical protein
MTTHGEAEAFHELALAVIQQECEDVLGVDRSLAIIERLTVRREAAAWLISDSFADLATALDINPESIRYRLRAYIQRACGLGNRCLRKRNRHHKLHTKRKEHTHATIHSNPNTYQRQPHWRGLHNEGPRQRCPRLPLVVLSSVSRHDELS